MSFRLVSLSNRLLNFNSQLVSLNSLIIELRSSIIELQESIIEPPESIRDVRESILELPESPGEFEVKMPISALTTAAELAERPLELSRRDEELEMLRIVWNEFCHCLNNPLLTIRTGVELLNSKGTAENTQSEILHNIIRSLDRAGEFQDQLQAMLKHSQDNPNVVTKHPADCIKEAYAEAGCEFPYQINHGLPNVKGHRYVWRRCLVNLLTNAIEASTDPKSIKMEARYTDDFVTIRIEDFGLGLQSRNGEIYQVGYSTKREKSVIHRGFGLSFCKWMIVDRYRGKLSVKNKGNGNPGVVAEMAIPTA